MMEHVVERVIRVSGEVQGDVEVARGYKLVIDSDASIHGSVRVAAGATAIIEGEVQGDLLAEGHVEIASGADVQGDIIGRAE